MTTMDLLQRFLPGVSDFMHGEAAPNTHDRATAHAGAPVVAGATSTMGQQGQLVGDLGRGLAQEGAAGLLDRAGMLDRQAAQRELSDRFQVVPDNFRGHRRGNMVTEAQYEHIAHMYSDIRLGRGDLTIDTGQITDTAQAATYRQGAMVNIADLMMTPGGRAQIERMQHNVAHDDAGHARHDASGADIHHHTTIRPYFRDANNDSNYTNDPHGVHDYENLDAFADARGASGENGAIDTSGRARQERVGGRHGARGQGVDESIYWNPTTNDGSRSDVILAHEMNHAYHGTQGTQAAGTYRVRSSRDFGVDNVERQATGLPQSGGNRHDDRVLTENEYIRQRNALHLGDHLRTRPAYNAPLR
jgi:hypothetical protein